MPVRKISWSVSGANQLTAVLDYILDDSSQNAARVVQKLEERLNTIADFPESCPPEKYKIDNDGSYRSFLLFHYRVSYRVTDNEIRILRIRHSSMKPKYF